MEKKKKKSSFVKKTVKWFFGILLTLIIVLIVSPFIFKDKITQMVKTTINNNINAVVSFDDVNLSFFRSFPQADVAIMNVSVVNKTPFKGDTLFYTREFHASMNITELFKKSDETMQLKSFSTSDGQVNILFNKNGDNNYDITKVDTVKKENTDTKETKFSLNIESYALNNMSFRFYDEQSKIDFNLHNIQHNGNGNFAQKVLDLDTKTNAQVSLTMDGVNYINKQSIKLDALLGIDLENSKYTFKENKAYINQLPLEFAGFIQLIGEDSNQLYDLTFQTPTSSFKNLLGIIPSQYVKQLNNIKTSGNFDVKGKVKGTLSKNTIPTFDVSLSAHSAMFKYPDLPKSVQNISLDTKIINTTGNPENTFINVNKLSFKIDEDVFNGSGKIVDFTTNPKVNIAANGVINLENIAQVYPIDLPMQLAGVLKADIKSVFDMNSIEKKQYQNIKNSGVLSINNFKYEGKDVAKPFFIDQASVSFNTSTVKLNNFVAKTGDSDVKVNGNLQNFYGFLFKNEILKGDFTLTSNQIKVSDFTTTSETTEENKETISTAVKVPAFLDCTFNAKATTVVYDNLQLNNVSGFLKIKDQTVSLQNLNMNAFGGLIKLNGEVSTKTEKPKFNMNLSLNSLNVQQSFSNLETLASIAPIANTIGGEMNSTLNLSGDLTNNMTPVLQSISGDLFGQLLNTQIKPANSKLLSYLSNEVSFIDVSKIDLNKLKASLSFKDGNVIIKPFDIKYDDISLNIGGSHGFDQTMNYKLIFDVPAKYFGKEVTDLIAKVNKNSKDKIQNIPINANLTGSFTNPKIQTDVKQATNKLISNLVKKQKEGLVDEGKNKLLNLINGDKDSTKSKKDGTDGVKSLINGLFGKKKKKKKDNN